MYKIMAKDYSNNKSLGIVNAHEYHEDTMMPATFAFFCNGLEMVRMLQNIGSNLERAMFWVVSNDGSRQPAYYIGQDEQDRSILVCEEDDRPEVVRLAA